MLRLFSSLQFYHPDEAKNTFSSSHTLLLLQTWKLMITFEMDSIPDGRHKQLPQKTQKRLSQSYRYLAHAWCGGTWGSSPAAYPGCDIWRYCMGLCTTICSHQNGYNLIISQPEVIVVKNSDMKGGRRHAFLLVMLRCQHLITQRLFYDYTFKCKIKKEIKSVTISP